MNYTLIALGIVLLLVIYVLYYVVTNKGKLVTTKLDLSAAGNGSVAYKTLANPTSSRYSFSVWMYIDALNAGANNNTDIINISTSAAADTPGNFFKLYIDSSTKLKYKMLPTDGPQTDNIIMTNCPLQKWVYIIVSVDGKIVDLYYDGKLIKSQQLEKVPKTTTVDFVITYGNCADSVCKGYLAKFERIPVAMDPTTAWSKYMEGNGGNYFSKLLSSYGASFTLTKDSIDLNRYTLF
jgi:hypothetical protein